VVDLGQLPFLVIGQVGGAAGPVGLPYEIAEDVVFKGGGSPQGIGGGQHPVQTADVVNGDIAQRVLLPDQLVALVEPVGGTPPVGVVVFGLFLVRVVGETIVVHAVGHADGDDSAFGVVFQVGAGDAAVAPVVEPAFFGVGVVEFAAEPAMDGGQFAFAGILVPDEIPKNPAFVRSNGFDETLCGGGDEKHGAIAVFDAPQMDSFVDEINAVAVSVFDGGQSADIRIVIRGFKDQGMLTAAVEEHGLSPRASQLIMGSFQVAGVKYKNSALC